MSSPNASSLSVSSLSVSPLHSSGLTLSPRLATPPQAAGRGAKAAREFEAQLIGSLLESLEKTFAALPGDESIPGSDDYNYLGTQALAQALADRGGFGIAAMIVRHLPATKVAHEGTEPASEGAPSAAAQVP
jgi:Rod binding domain-containing protein